MTRIWYQSFVDPDAHGPYFRRLRAGLEQIASPGTEIEIGGVSPGDVHLSRLTELRCSLTAIDNAIAAGEAGVDAVVFGHFQDSGVWEARVATDVPVIGMGEATILFAQQLGRTFGLISIDDVFGAIHREQIERMGLAGRLSGIRAMEGCPVSELVGAFEDPGIADRVVATFHDCCRALIADGAEVVIPAGGLFGLLALGRRDLAVAGVSVVNPVAVSLWTAELAASLRALDGTTTSRAGTFQAAAPEAIAEFRARPAGA